MIRPSNRFPPHGFLLVLAASVLTISPGCASHVFAASGSLSSTVSIAIILPQEIEPIRARLSTEVKDAIDTAAAFFGRYGFGVDVDSVVDSAYIFATVESARLHCAARFGVPEEEVPTTFSGTVSGHVLLVVAPDVFKTIFANLYGEERWAENEYHKLLVHEVTHRIHALIAVELFGSEDGMGPRWFFEGLATASAGQFNESAKEPSLSRATLGRYIEADDQDKLPSPVYPIYRRMFDAAAQNAPVPWLISHAGDSTFVMQLLQLFDGVAK